MNIKKWDCSDYTASNFTTGFQVKSANVKPTVDLQKKNVEVIPSGKSVEVLPSK